MFNKINGWLERNAYKVYAKLNTKRKAQEAGLKIYKFFDDVRRKTGFVK